MDERVRVTPTTARWLAVATAGLLAVGVISAGVVDARGSGPDAAVVSAAGSTTPTVDVSSSSTTTAPLALPPVTQAPPSTVAGSTTVPKAAAAVLAAIGTTAPPTTQPPATTTTKAPVPPTTATTASTTTTVPRRASVTFVNEHPNAVVVTFNRRSIDLAAGEQEVVDVALDDKDTVAMEVRIADIPASTCPATKVPAQLQSGGRYRVAVVAGPVGCQGLPEPRMTIVPA